MLLLFWALWVVFNGRLTLEIALLGLLISGVLYAAVCLVSGWSPRKDWRLLRGAPGAARYMGLLIRAIFLANFQVLRFVFSAKYEPEPQLVTFRTGIRKPVSRAVLANSITLTPGTITASVEGDRFTVHCLDESMADDLKGGAFETRLMDMEGRP